MVAVTLYSRSGCKLCKEAEADLNGLQNVIPHTLKVVDIDSDPLLHDLYALEVPVVEVGSFKLKASFTRQVLQMTLQAAARSDGPVGTGQPRNLECEPFS